MFPRIWSAIPLLVATFVIGAAGCSAANTLTGGDDNFKAVGALWSDVPAMEGLGKPIDAELPTSIKLFMRTGVNVMMKGLGEGSPAWDWLAFSTTKTPEDVKNFYTKNAQMGLDVAASETTDKFPTDPRFGSIGTEPSYLLVNNQYGAFFAWTRGGYYFSASAKNGQAALDAFMQAFPY